nr:MAG TPA: hypothetical protein [Caudoviricetes sp.]
MGGYSFLTDSRLFFNLIFIARFRKCAFLCGVKKEEKFLRM